MHFMLLYYDQSCGPAYRPCLSDYHMTLWCDQVEVAGLGEGVSLLIISSVALSTLYMPHSMPLNIRTVHSYWRKP